VNVWQTDNGEELSTIWSGVGWVATTSDAGMVAITPGGESYAVLPVEAQRSIAIDDHRARREQLRVEAEREARFDNLRARMALGLEQPVSFGEVFARAGHMADRDDARERHREERLVASVRSGELDVVERPTNLRSQRYTMEREARERREAAAVRPVEGAELDQLRQEVTHLRAQLHALRRQRGGY
jgi:hypothetical protein